jgi:hypothetical protein
LPKIQARKLYQYAQERKESEREARRLRDLEQKRAESGALQFEAPVAAAYQPPVAAAPAPVVPSAPPAPEPVHIPEPVAVTPKPDELTEKLKKLKTLFDHGLISQEEYNHKKMELLSDF